MQDNKRMADEANRMGQQVQERFQTGFEAASRSFTEANKGFQTLAAEMMEYSKAAFDDAIRTWEQLIGVGLLSKQSKSSLTTPRGSTITTWPN
jgi:hypothetical protein